MKISVIVPIYNVEKYLPRCIESIINQSYQELEIILVNDGSTDNGPQICDDYALRDPRIVVIHKKNEGLSEARNSGVKYATGKFITFVDSDDYISEVMCETLFGLMYKNNAEIVECKYKKIYEDKKNRFNESDLKFPNITIFNTKESLKTLMENSDKISQTVWGKLYKKDLISEILFPYGVINEDEYWTYQILGKSKKLVVTDEVLYFYVQREGSIMNKNYSLKRLDCIEALKERCEYMNKNYPELEELAVETYFGACFYHFQLLCKNNSVDSKREARKNILEKVRKLDKSILYKNKKFKYKVWNYLFIKSPYVICKTRNLLKIGV